MYLASYLPFHFHFPSLPIPYISPSFPKLIVGDSSHIYLQEQGGTASIAGVLPKIVRTLPDGTLPLDIIK